MNKFVYLIYDTNTLEVFEVYGTEDECVSAYRAKYNDTRNCDWLGLNLRYLLSFWLNKELRK